MFILRFFPQTEKARHLLSVRDKILEQRKSRDSKDVIDSTLSSAALAAQSKPDKDYSNQQRLLADRTKSKDGDDAVCSPDRDVVNGDVDEPEMASEQRQNQLMVKCLKLLRQKHFLELAAEAGSNQARHCPCCRIRN